MVSKCTLGCPEHNFTCYPNSHWDALELYPFAQGCPLAFSRSLTERSSLTHYFIHMYSIVFVLFWVWVFFVFVFGLFVFCCFVVVVVVVVIVLLFFDTMALM